MLRGCNDCYESAVSHETTAIATDKDFSVKLLSIQFVQFDTKRTRNVLYRMLSVTKATLLASKKKIQKFKFQLITIILNAQAC
jgi:hypothetical protein